MTTDPRLARITRLIRDVPDFPRPGILFRDLTPLLADPESFRATVDLLAERLVTGSGGRRPELVVGIEARGFIFGAALADRLSVGFVPVRKRGKLPFRTAKESYELEYGTDTLEMHVDAVQNRRCVILDDLLATGGTAAATARLVEGQGGSIDGFAFVLELDFLKGRDKLGKSPIHALVHY